MSVDEMYNMIIELKIVGEEALRLAVNLNGKKEKTLNDVVWIMTGHPTLQDYCEWEGIEYENEE